MEKIAVYPGSFDPITNGHVSIIERALNIFDRLIVTVAVNASKNPLFTIAERQEMIREATREYPGVMVDTFEGLLVDYVVAQGARVILRGLRAVSDFEYEFQIAQMNHNLRPEVETLFMMTSVPYGYLSSSIVKEVAALNGPVETLVPPPVYKALQDKFTRR